MIRMSVLSVLTKNSFTMTELRMSEKAANVQRKTSKDLQKVWLWKCKETKGDSNLFTILYIVICNMLRNIAS